MSGYTKCKNCTFFDRCGANAKQCGHYSPIADDISDDRINEIIEIERLDFYEQWLEELMEYDDDVYFF